MSRPVCAECCHSSGALNYKDPYCPMCGWNVSGRPQEEIRRRVRMSLGFETDPNHPDDPICGDCGFMSRALGHKKPHCPSCGWNTYGISKTDILEEIRQSIGFNGVEDEVKLLAFDDLSYCHVCDSMEQEAST